MIEWVAEIGSSHKGNKALSHELIRQAALSGATVTYYHLGGKNNAGEVETPHITGKITFLIYCS